jgi:DNA-binding HxlR family transcriptional regulator
MTRYLTARGIRIFDFTQFAKPLTEAIKANAERLAAENGLVVDYIRKKNFRKEDKIKAILRERGEHPGLVWIFSALEPCTTYQPWHDKPSGRTYLRPDDGKCLHYYFYFIDEELGLCYVRVPTWCPFRLQFYCNGHSWLARKLAAAGIDYTLADNAFVGVAELERAQAIADALGPDELHRRLDRYAQSLCPVGEVFGQSYHWSLMQVEYSTDLIFRSEASLGPLYEQLSRQAVLAVKAEQVASFLGKKITPALAQEIGSRFATRIEGTCIKHRFGKTGVKMYDKFGRVLRLETTTNDVSFFKHHRKVEHDDGTTTRKLAPLKKSIYSLIDLREILAGCNRRYLEFLSALEDTSSGARDLAKLTEPRREGERTIKGLNFFERTEQALLRALQRPEFNIHGLRRADVKPFVPLSDSALSRQLHRLRALGLIKRVTRSYRYYLTRLGRAAIAAACSLTQFTSCPQWPMQNDKFFANSVKTEFVRD